MKCFYFNPPVSVKLSESYRIISIPRTSMRSILGLTVLSKNALTSLGVFETNLTDLSKFQEREASVNTG